MLLDFIIFYFHFACDYTDYTYLKWIRLIYNLKCEYFRWRISIIYWWFGSESKCFEFIINVEFNLTVAYSTFVTIQTKIDIRIGMFMHLIK